MCLNKLTKGLNLVWALDCIRRDDNDRISTKLFNFRFAFRFHRWYQFNPFNGIYEDMSGTICSNFFQCKTLSRPNPSMIFLRKNFLRRNFSDKKFALTSASVCFSPKPSTFLKIWNFPSYLSRLVMSYITLPCFYPFRAVSIAIREPSANEIGMRENPKVWKFLISIICQFIVCLHK